MPILRPGRTMGMQLFRNTAGKIRQNARLAVRLKVRGFR